VNTKLGAYLLLILFFAVACGPGNISRENMAKKSITSIPMESVDAETGGTKGGGTHFHILSGELCLDYQYYDDEAGANRRLDEMTSTAKRVIEQGPVPSDAGNVGGKFVITETDSTYPNKGFA
jgi:hypothetical protein